MRWQGAGIAHGDRSPLGTAVPIWAGNLQSRGRFCPEGKNLTFPKAKAHCALPAILLPTLSGLTALPNALSRAISITGLGFVACQTKHRILDSPYATCPGKGPLEPPTSQLAGVQVPHSIWRSTSSILQQQITTTCPAVEARTERRPSPFSEFSHFIRMAMARDFIFNLRNEIYFLSQKPVGNSMS